MQRPSRNWCKRPLNSVTQTCAKLHGITLVRNKDIRKFLDGIYVEEGGAIPVPEE